MFLGKSFPCLVLCLLVLLSLSCRQVSFPSGTKLSGNDPASPFLLQNQFGSDKSLYDYAGKVVVLTFLYTSCSDICPVVARHLRTTYEVLKNKDTEFNIVVISVDPKRDSVERVYEYSKRWSMLNKWDFLTGEEQLLLPIWTAYYVSEPEKIGYGQEELVEGAINGSQKGGTEIFRDKIAEQYSVSHSSPVYVIDSEGYLRMVFTLPFDPDDLIKYVESIMD